MLITEEMVKSMKKGSVIVDLAAENGGNCALTQPGSVVERHGVHIIGYIDLPSRLAPTASVLYGNNLAYLLERSRRRRELPHRSQRRGRAQCAGRPRRHDRVAAAEEGAAACAGQARARHRASRRARRARRRSRAARVWPGYRRRVALAAACSRIGFVAPPAFLSHLTVFALACIVGWQVVWNVTPALHTPLMSVTNAISGIIVVGGMLDGQRPASSPAVILGAVAILLASINIAGGFLVTQRMLRMFRR